MKNIHLASQIFFEVIRSFSMILPVLMLHLVILDYLCIPYWFNISYILIMLFSIFCVQYPFSTCLYSTVFISLTYIFSLSLVIFIYNDIPSFQVIPTQMKRVPADESLTDASLLENVIIDPVVRGFIRDWDAMEDLLSHVLYTGLGWEIGNEGQILFTDPLATPKV